MVDDGVFFVVYNTATLMLMLLLLFVVVLLQVTKAEFACKDKGGAESSTCSVLMELAQENSIDLLVVGSFGRKGEKL